ncbi:uncharacterized protein BCR38DRAFT_343684 [Pseudomassariella vexata]|uniref:Involucrin repeat protein n=1 Tax=Pseudomassariella vexata TaxID=1141098 RepID=A0A1Y2DXT8_9PEZI|nr:uncharacterized protein BCR38DRAFT_343684 [Pseudomassariella vexata]ORY64112.1 hypothetical protein BCR38DRAFT_343684 [Pseudomassariella vexata]
MSSSDKRRGGSSTHTLRSSTSSRSSSIIAPPPRAQLGNNAPSSSSPGADSDNISQHHEAGPSNAGSSKDGASLAASEKDDEIVKLKRQIVEMEENFARQVDRLSLNETETASFWQGKYSTLNQQFLRTDTELRLLRNENDSIREGKREQLRERWEILKQELMDRDDEIQRLKTQNKGLKEWVNVSTKTDDQTSDEVFGDGMARLGNGLQNWVVVHFRRAKLDLSKVSKAVISELAQLIPRYEELAGPAKVHLLQSIVSGILVEMIFDAYFVGLSKEQTNQLKQTEQFLASLKLLGSDEAVKQWRATTLIMIRTEAPQKLQAETAAVTEHVISRINRILGAITDAKTTDARDQALRVQVNNSIELARLLSVQKADFRVTMPQILPHQKTIFNASEMEDIGGEEEDSLAAREICCVTFPLIIKFGDERGSHPQYRNVIAKARVLCAPE